MCNFNIDFDGNSNDIIAKAEKAIADAGGSFNKDTSTGGTFALRTIAGNIEGSYNIENTALQISIINRPFFVSCDTIKNKLKEYLKGV